MKLLARFNFLNSFHISNETKIKRKCAKMLSQCATLAIVYAFLKSQREKIDSLDSSIYVAFVA